MTGCFISPKFFSIHSLQRKTFSCLTTMKVKVTQSCPTLCDPMDYTVHEILQTRILECVAFPFSRGSSQPRNRTRSPALQTDSLPNELSGKPKLTSIHTHTHTEVAQSCPTLCDPMDCSPPGASVHGIFQAWILEWVAISFSIPLPKSGN